MHFLETGIAMWTSSDKPQCNINTSSSAILIAQRKCNIKYCRPCIRELDSESGFMCPFHIKEACLSFFLSFSMRIYGSLCEIVP